MELSNVLEEHNQTLTQIIINKSQAQRSCYVVEVTTSIIHVVLCCPNAECKKS